MTDDELHVTLDIQSASMGSTTGFVPPKVDQVDEIVEHDSTPDKGVEEIEDGEGST